MAWRLYPHVTSLILSSTSLEKLDEELKHKKDINTLDTTSRTALHYCILQEVGAVKTTGYEYETIIDENNSGDCRMTRAMAEVQWLDLKKPTMHTLGKWPKRLAYAYLLCENGADVNLKDKGGIYILSIINCYLFVCFPILSFYNTNQNSHRNAVPTGILGNRVR